MKFLLTLLIPSALLALDVRPIPPPGIEIPPADRAAIESGVKELGGQIATLRERGKQDPFIARELPNVEIFHKSADWAVRHGEIFDKKQIEIAKDHILQGLDRAAALRNGETPWNTATGLVARGYRSKIDGSVQPYGLLVPSTFKAGSTEVLPLNFWCHGRGEKNTELPFIHGTQYNKGEFAPEGQFTCYLFGRYCCANKFAGEADLFEAWEDVAAHYPVDDRRLVVRGFSMGGAACWQFAFHFPGVWAAAAPGAGFSETEEFFQGTLYADGAMPPPWWERHLWRWYDVTLCARNVAGLPVVAYSGEIDRQKQAADIMLRYAAQEGRSFTHIIGPDTAHKYHPDAKPVIEKFIEVALSHGNDPVPKSVAYTTYSLIYPKRDWVEILRMDESWERADVDATIAQDTLTVKTKNISALRLTPGIAAFPSNSIPKLIIDGAAVPIDAGTAVLAKTDGKWTPSEIPQSGKRPGICGPVDHAFMSRFLFVRPTGTPLNETAGKWVASEMNHAIQSWRAVFRGDAPIKDDTAVTDDDIAHCNLILWGDSSSNAVLKRVAEKLPVSWEKDTLTFKGYGLDPAHYAPILIHPNPLNPSRYLVLNSGHTFRKFALLNNSDQTPKIPDWALVDIRVPADAKWPGLIYDAGFFDEDWK